MKSFKLSDLLIKVIAMLLLLPAQLLGPAVFLLGLYTWQFGIAGKIGAVSLIIISINPLLIYFMVQMRILTERPIKILPTILVMTANTIFFTLISILI